MQSQVRRESKELNRAPAVERLNGTLKWWTLATGRLWYISAIKPSRARGPECGLILSGRNPLLTCSITKDFLNEGEHVPRFERLIERPWGAEQRRHAEIVLVGQSGDTPCLGNTG